MKETEGTGLLEIEGIVTGQVDLVEGNSISAGDHRMYITDYGAWSETCRNMGSIYNPEGASMGTYWSPERRIGDIKPLSVS